MLGHFRQWFTDKTDKERNRFVVGGVVLLLAGIFLWDLLTPIGFTPWVLYAFVPLLSLLSPSRGNPLLIAALCSLLVIIGFYWSPAGTAPVIAIFNRSVGIVMLWIIALGIVLVQRRHLALCESEEALRTSQERLRLTMQEAHLGTWSWDIPRDVITWYGDLKALFGLSTDSPFFCYEDFLATIHPDDREQVAAAVSQTLSGAGSYNAEFRVIWPDGSVHWLAERGSLFRDSDGVPSRMVGISKEITERKRLEDARQTFVSLANNSVEFIGMCDMKFQPFYVNEAGMRMVGLESVEQACQTPVKDFFFPEDQAFIYDEFFPRVLRDGKGEVEIRFRHFRTGDALWMLYNVFTLTDAKGNAVGFATVNRNITERKRGEQALQESEERLRLILESSPNGIVLANTEGRIVLVNGALETISGYGRTELIGLAIEELVPERYRSPHVGYRTAFAALPHVRPFGEGPDFLLRRKDGTECPVEISLVPIAMRDGPRVLCSLIDITGRKRGEEALRAAYAEVAQRVQELVEQREQLRRLAASNEDLREQAARHVAHELHDEAGQMLAAVQIELARMAGKDSAVHNEQIRHVKTLVTKVEEQLRHLAHELRPTILDDLGLGPALEFLSQGVAQRWGLKISVTGVITIDLPAKVATVLYRVAQEALANVVRHAEASEVILRLERQPTHVRLVIRDDGKGFDVGGALPGQRGLGLLGIQERVIAVDGTVEIHSRPDDGTDLVVTVPLITGR